MWQDQSSAQTSHTQEVQRNSFVLHSHTKAEVKISYQSLRWVVMEGLKSQFAISWGRTLLR